MWEMADVYIKLSNPYDAKKILEESFELSKRCGAQVHPINTFRGAFT